MLIIKLNNLRTVSTLGTPGTLGTQNLFTNYIQNY